MKILAIGAHIDDIELACGGTIIKAVKQMHQVKMLVLSDSGYSNYDGKVLRTKEEALEEGMKAAKVIGVEDFEVLNYNTKDIPYDSKVVENIDKRISAFNPDIIFTHWPFDTHQAHKNVALSSISAARYYNTILMYEPIAPAGRSYVGFRAQVYVDITDFIEVKKQCLKAHKSQIRKYGKEWIEAIQARAKHRGFEMGVKFAEVFEVMRFELKL
jgi:LmbE family N-acetylglucosaminyl deacetylase